MPEASPDVRALYRRHTRGNSLFRNDGNGRFEDTTLDARADMGRWAWSSDALDFDSDGWEDLYVANGMLTRDTASTDLEGFFWRQVVARSPAARVRSAPYDDAWRAMNQLLVRESIASRQRNVFLRNDGRGGFDDVSGALGLDLDQDGRSFAVLDVDRDGDPDLAVMAARQAPQLRIFRNDFQPRGAALAIRLVGAESNRDAIGARVVVETDALRRVKIVQAGSGFLSQHSKELLFGLGPSRRVQKLTVVWPSGRTQVFTDVALNSRLRLVEDGALEQGAFGSAPALDVSRAPTITPPPSETWFYEPFPAPELSAEDVRGETRSLAALRGHPALVLIWSGKVERSRSALDALSRGYERLTQAGVGALAIALDPPAGRASAGRLPMVTATREIALNYAILSRHLFMNRQDLRIPTAFLLDAAGSVVKAYRDRLDVSAILRDAERIDATPAERLARALPFPGTLYGAVPVRNYLPYGRELLDQGLETAALVAYERAARVSPSAFTFYRLGTLLARRGNAREAGAAFERALALQPDLAEASNDLGTLLAQTGQLDAAIERFQTSACVDARIPRRSQQSRLRAPPDGTRRRSSDALRASARAAAGFPRSAEQSRTAPGPERESGTGGALLPRRAGAKAGLRRGGQQSGTRSRQPRAERRSRQSPGRPGRESAAVRERVHHARQDSFEREPHARGDCDPRTAAATKPEASCRARASPELETVTGAPRPTPHQKNGRHREVGAGRDENCPATQKVKRVTS